MSSRRFKKPKKLTIYKRYFKNEFSAIRDYIDETKELIRSKQEEFEKFVNRELEKANNNPLVEQEIIEHHIDDLMKYDGTYIELLMNSTFITSFSLFETAFTRICNYAQLEKEKQLKVNDLNGQGTIDKCRKYIEKVIEVDLSALNSEWSEIKNYNKVRNIIVHNSANFRKEKDKNVEKQEMYLFIVSDPSIQLKTVGRGNFYIKDQKFILDFCDKGEYYLEEVVKKILEKT